MNAPTELPAPLQPWRPWLGWFEPLLADALGQLVRRLAELAGPASANTGRVATEPDGLGDLRLRGTYERLLTSEWLLADEIPDEFLRRAAAAEHLFLAPQLRAIPSERIVVAIFDAGPRQLGAPRLAQLAAWVLLARRAVDLGGTLRWGLLHQPGQLHEADAPQRLLQLLNGRCLAAGGAAQEAAWKAALLEQGDVDAEVWWVGAAGAAPARRERRLVLRPTLAGDALEAELVASSTTRRARLPLPADDVTTRLLRGRFEVEAAAAPRPVKADAKLRMALNRAPLFSRFGSHVAVRALTGHAMLVLKMPAPGQGGRVSWRRQEWSSARPLVAAQLHKGQSFGLALDDEQLYFWQVDRFAARPRPSREDFEPAVSAGRWMPLSLLGAGAERLVCVIDRRNRLLAWTPSLAPVHEIDKQVIGMVNLDHERLAYAVFWGNGVWLRELDKDGDETPLRRRLCKVDESQAAVFFALQALPGGQARLGALAVRQQKAPHESWRLFAAARPELALDAEGGADEREVVLQPGEQAVGVFHAKAGAASLVFLSAGRGMLRLQTREGRRNLFNSTTPITQCTVCPHTGRVAVLTQARELIVLSSDGGRLMTVQDAGGEAAEGQDD
ncbi:hypothetical protein [Roseateles sp. P5_E4]